MNLFKNATILIIDDNPLDLLLMEETLGYLCKKLLVETDNKIALQTACEQQPDIILLDILMRDVDGYDVCRQLKANPLSEPIPVIFLSSLIRTEDKVKGFDAGGVDYVSKPFETDELVARVESSLKLHLKLGQSKAHSSEKIAAHIIRYQLTEKEIKILRLYAAGLTRHKIGERLFISENTVKWHLKNILSKLDVENRSQAIEKLHKIGILNN